jgi:hypothetical protein
MNENTINMKILDFSPYTSDGRVLSLSGRPKGEGIRKDWNLDELEADPLNMFFIKIPEKMYGLAPSLIQGLFTKTIDTIGKEEFYRRYKFSPHEILVNQIKRVIDGLPSKSNVGGV